MAKRKSSGGSGGETPSKAVKTADPAVLKILTWPLDFASKTITDFGDIKIVQYVANGPGSFPGPGLRSASHKQTQPRFREVVLPCGGPDRFLQNKYKSQAGPRFTACLSCCVWVFCTNHSWFLGIFPFGAYL